VADRLRIAYDARMVGLPGIGRFIVGLWQGLSRVGADVVGLAPGPRVRHWLGEERPPPAGAHVTIRARPFLLAEQLVLPVMHRRLHADVHHATHFNVPYGARRPIVLTVYDLIAVLDPSKARSRATGAYHRFGAPLAMRRASLLVPISHHTARELHERLGIPAERMRVIEPGLDLEHWRPQPSTEVAALRRRLALPSAYLLYVGTAKPHKNLATLLAAHAEDHPPLVLAGPTYAELEAGGLEPRDRDRVHVLGRVADGDLPLLYAGAIAVLVPSLHEGFGFTPLEGMACGAPVVSSDGGALPETVGDAALVVQARDVEAWRDALSAVTTDDDLRRRLVQAGRRHVSGRTWERSAQRYVEVYAEAASP
jgi:alpha-1,3-rhamnosyl/mannosyltransferase